MGANYRICMTGSSGVWHISHATTLRLRKRSVPSAAGDTSPLNKYQHGCQNMRDLCEMRQALAEGAVSE